MFDRLMSARDDVMRNMTRPIDWPRSTAKVESPRKRVEERRVRWRGEREGGVVVVVVEDDDEGEEGL